MDDNAVFSKELSADESSKDSGSQGESQVKSSINAPSVVDAKNFNIYDETATVFVDPCFMVDVKNFSCLTFKLSMNRMIRTS